MSAIAGASAGVKDMADGSLRITIEFEPKDAKNAFELFGSRGTPIAVAALRVGFAAVKDDEQPVQPVERVKVGPLCREAVGYCQMPEFHDWAAGAANAPMERFNEEKSKDFILKVCQIETRKELDSIPYAADLFKEFVRIPFMRYMKTRQSA